MRSSRGLSISNACLAPGRRAISAAPDASLSQRLNLRRISCPDASRARIPGCVLPNVSISASIRQSQIRESRMLATGPRLRSVLCGRFGDDYTCRLSLSGLQSSAAFSRRKGMRSCGQSGIRPHSSRGCIGSPDSAIVSAWFACSCTLPARCRRYRMKRKKPPGHRMIRISPGNRDFPAESLQRSSRELTETPRPVSHRISRMPCRFRQQTRIQQEKHHQEIRWSFQPL